jgi:hypothetical protein
VNIERVRGLTKAPFRGQPSASWRMAGVIHKLFLKLPLRTKSVPSIYYFCRVIFIQ